MSVNSLRRNETCDGMKKTRETRDIKINIIELSSFNKTKKKQKKVQLQEPSHNAATHSV